MAILREAVDRQGVRALSASVDLQTGAESAFALLCAIEKWPVWLSFLRSAEVPDETPLGPGSEVVLRSAIPGEPEQLFEVDRYITNFQLSLVGAYSTRRRLDFRLERKTARCKLTARVEYPAYGGKVALMMDGIGAGRKLATQLEESLTQFKHLAEFNHAAKDELLADF
ncbi:MAG: SRPBCC family protein [Candidatus Baltobacteraceae bacterium]